MDRTSHPSDMGSIFRCAENSVLFILPLLPVQALTRAPTFVINNRRPGICARPRPPPSLHVTCAPPPRQARFRSDRPPPSHMHHSSYFASHGQCLHVAILFLRHDKASHLRQELREDIPPSGAWALSGGGVCSVEQQ
ncbi:hypothetical protein B0H10DRAFT_1224249 [Mycena sp. CBHHK59/15]|nr:hypothetical protein B0H10DRAFT_1277649 [Mycena sp. CBHHK59/15]KAJ6618699.1 hypothetical protein B0H10DRAFT_1224249 [Mycena sp. CBHHK59/15]